MSVFIGLLSVVMRNETEGVNKEIDIKNNSESLDFIY